MFIKYFVFAITLLVLSGCADEQTRTQPDIPTAKAPIVKETPSMVSGKVVGTTEVYDRKLNKRITVTVIEKDGRYYDASDGQELFGYRPKGSDRKLKNKNQAVHELKMQ